MPTVRARFIEPMLLQQTARLPEGAQWLYELKLGRLSRHRVKTGGRIHLLSRNDKDFTSRYPAIASALSSLPDETVIDGEVVALEKTGKPSFNLVQRTRGMAWAEMKKTIYSLAPLRRCSPACPASQASPIRKKFHHPSA